MALLRKLRLLLILPLVSLPVWAKSAHSKKSSSKTEKTVKGDGIHRSDPEIRALLRKSAPFYVEERFRGDTVRINKDGTFSREGEAGGYVTEGHWKVAAGKMKMKWTTGEEYGYRMSFSGRTPLLVGHKPNKEGRYTIISMD